MKGFRSNLAVSLHAPNNDLRSASWKSAERPIRKCLRREIAETTNRQVTFNYINEVNDGVSRTENLAELLKKDQLSYVNDPATVNATQL